MKTFLLLLPLAACLPGATSTTLVPFDAPVDAAAPTDETALPAEPTRDEAEPSRDEGATDEDVPCDAATDEDVPDGMSADVLGTYRGFFCPDQPFITTLDISRDDALANCALNAMYNPHESVRCMWNGEEILRREVTPGACDDVGVQPPPDGPTGPDGTCLPDGFTPSAFEVPQDAMSCDGARSVRYDARQGLWVGIVACAPGTWRFYLSDGADGPFLPAMDVAGHGQDHCELVDPGFTLGNEDDITSGSCPTCAIGWNLPLEGVAGWYRGFLGEPFRYVAETGPWSYQVSQVTCGCGGATARRNHVLVDRKVRAQCTRRTSQGP